MMAFVPPMVRRVISNGYVVREGDDMGSIAAGFTGCSDRYMELVGANLHKRIRNIDTLLYQGFDSLEPGERINVPGNWISAGDSVDQNNLDEFSGGVGCTPMTCAQVGAECGVAPDGCGGTINCGTCPAGHKCGVGGPNKCGLSGSYQINQKINQAGQFNINSPVIDQLGPLTNIISTVINGGGAPTPVSPIDTVSGVVAQWWPYLQLPPNNFTLPQLGSDPYVLINWLGGINNNASIFKDIVAAADRYVQAFKSLPYWPWDKVPWSDLAANWSKLLIAFSSNPQAILELMQLGVKIAAIPATTPWQSIGQYTIKNATYQTPYSPPAFTQVDWTQPPYSTLIAWFNSGAVDPTKIPWDMLMDTETTDCALAHPGRLAAILADQVCFTTGCYGDPVANYKKSVCADTYTPGWCSGLKCQDGSGGGGGGDKTPVCSAKTCAQQNIECGSATDGCGNAINCGNCADGKECSGGKCVAKSSSWIGWAIGGVSVLALGVGGYVLAKKKGVLPRANPSWGNGNANFSGKIYLERIPLNRGGYTRYGRYYGIGAPLFSYRSIDGEVEGNLRARDRASAKDKIREMYPRATFGR